MILKPPSIHIRNLTLNYKNTPIFTGLSTSFMGGIFNILLGASGVGKSSLLKMIAGLLPITEGEISYDHPEPLSTQISYMAQQDLLLPWASVINNVMLGSKLRKEKKNKDQALHILNQVGLAEAQNQLPSQLSGGMRQRAALARTLYENRPIVLMDEPFSALDIVTRTKMQDYTAQLLKGKTVILITHDPFEACRLGEHIQVLAGNPVRIYDIEKISGDIPRHPEDLNVQKAQADLLNLLITKSAS